MKKHRFFKRFSACVMVVIMTLTAVPLSGFVGFEVPKWSELFSTKASALSENGYTYTVSYGHATITGRDSSISGDVVIPDTLGGYPVTAISNWAFENCTGLTNITIPDSVTSIGNNAFYGCTNLTSVTLGNGVTSIGDFAFIGCTGLTNITIPESVTRINSYAFYNCIGLTSVIIPTSVTSIGSYAFYNCTGLASVIIPDSVTSIGSFAFSGCTGLTNIRIPYSVTIIPYGAFSGCAGLTSITIPDSITTISSYAFKNCKSLKRLEVPNSVTSIGNYAFSACTDLTNITLPDGIKAIDTYTFYDCSNLDDVIIPNSVSTIGEYAFGGCTNLTKITLPDGIRTINKYTFSDCSNLDNVIVPNSVITIGEYAFDSCTNLTNLTIGNGVTKISESAFFKCTNLARVNIYDLAAWCGISFSNNLSNPLYYAHNIYINDTLATNIKIPYKVTNINPFAFNGCTCLSSIIIPDSVTSIGGSAFGNCTNLKDVYFCGTEEQWNMIKISSYNESLSDATLHFNHQHDYLSIITEIPTCTKSGMKTLTCECGRTYNDIVPPLGHSFTNYISDNNATCISDGTKTAKCDREACDETDTVTDTGSAKGHTYKTTTTKATTTKDGKAVTACEVCGEVSGTVTIYKASSIKLSKTSYTYNGKVQKPTVTVKDSKGKTLKNGTDYTVSYASGCKKTGKYAIKITFKGNYSGTKTLYFNILPSKTTKLSASQTTTSIKATWKAVTGATGYKVTLYNAKGKAVKTVYTTKTTASFTKLSKGTTYKVRVTAYKTIDGKKVSSSVYTQITTATKPGTPTLKVTAGAKKASLSWNKQTGASGYVVYMATSKNGTYKKIATVKGGTKTSYTKTGLTKGKTYYFKVRAYVAPDSKTTVYGDYSAVKYTKIK